MRCTIQLLALALLGTTSQILAAPLPQAQSIQEAEQSSGINDAASRANSTITTGSLENDKAPAGSLDSRSPMSITAAEDASGITNLQNKQKNHSSSITTGEFTGSKPDTLISRLRRAMSIQQASAAAGIDANNDRIQNASSTISTGSLDQKRDRDQTSSQAALEDEIVNEEQEEVLAGQEQPQVQLRRRSQSIAQAMESSGINANNARINNGSSSITTGSLPQPGDFRSLELRDAMAQQQKAEENMQESPRLTEREFSA